MKPFRYVISLLLALESIPLEAADSRFQVSQHEYSLPEVTLIDSQGQPQKIRELLSGRAPFLLNFVFASCTTICPVLTATFASAQRMLNENKVAFRMLSVSIDPEQDTPEQLTKYAARYRAGSNWMFLTGETGAVESLQKSLNAYRGGKNSHPSLILIRTRENGPWIRLEGSVPGASLVAEYRKALKLK